MKRRFSPVLFAAALASPAAHGSVGWAEGDDVVVPAGETLVLDESTPRLGSLTVKGTLCLSNWMTRVSAGSVVVSSGGVIRPAAAFADTEMSNRVWIVCDELTVAAGGKIYADKLGYRRCSGPAWSGIASPPGNASGAYGGAPGKGTARTYGDAVYPSDPGSGGVPYKESNTCTLCGGGAVRLDVSGPLVVDGSVSADGSDTEGHIYTGGGMGSGGGIWITCRTIDGTGSVTARGNLSTQGYSSTYALGGGGGGRIAVHYDIEAQAEKDESCHVRFDARGGAGVLTETGEQFDIGYPSYIGGAGTLYFPDSRFLSAGAYRRNGWRFAGRWMSPGAVPASIAVEGDFILDGCALKLPVETLSVGGDLIVKGEYARTQFFELTNATVTVGGDCLIEGGGFSLYGGKLAVGGNLTVTNTYSKNSKEWSGELRLKASETNGVADVDGVSLDVSGRWILSGYSLCRLFCHPVNGSVPGITVGSLFVGADGWICADEGGWGPLTGPGYVAGKGAAYGGTGGGTGSGNLNVYGSLKNPVDPGSGTSGNNGQSGGGVVKMTVRGSAKILGDITAQGSQYVRNWVHGGSGGSILVRCGRLLPSTGTISAAGATGGGYSHRGGGGRIAFYWGAGDVSGLVFSAAKGGGNAYTYMSPWVDASDGTVYLKKTGGFFCIVR